MKRIYAFLIDFMLIALECIPFVYILNGVFEISIETLIIISVASFYFLNSLIFRTKNHNQTLGDIVVGTELRTKNGELPSRFKLLLRDFVIGALILYCAKGLFSSLGLVIAIFPVGKQKYGHLMSVIDIVFNTYYMDKKNNKLKKNS